MMCLDDASSTRVEDRPREFASSKQAPNKRDAAEVDENTSGAPISAVDFHAA